MCLFAQAASATTFYVDVNNTNPVPPYADWSTAATNIQDAINVAVTGDQIWVNDGIYSTGGATVNNSPETNRVAVNKAVTVQSVNGPAVTVINGGDQIRCVYLAAGATLAGFTLTNGLDDWFSYYGDFYQDGGGVYCESISATVSNCVISGNSTGDVGGGADGGTLINCVISGNFALEDGGGAVWGTLINCTLEGNRVHDESGGGAAGCTLNNCTLTANDGENGLGGGGAIGCTLNNCTLTSNTVGSWPGGGAYYCTLNNCVLTGNESGYRGGGACACTLNNCTLTGNWAFDEGGGAAGCTLNNCTLTGNSTGHLSPGIGGGAAGCTLNNCILYFNPSTWGSNYDSTCTLNYCCTTPLPASGIGNFDADPLFVDTNEWSNLHLQSDSPCINAGDNIYAPAGSDLDGNPRIVGGTVDMGAYEYQTPSSFLSYAWAQQYGLPTDGSADYTDSDGTGMDNWQKSFAGLNPTNSASILTMLTPVVTNNPPGLVVTWESVNTRAYFLQCSTNLEMKPAFAIVQSNIIGQAGTTTYTDTNAIGNGPFFYRVGVQ